MARGSRYNVERSVGRDTQSVLSWVDIAKAHLHIGNVVPVPDRVFRLTTDNFLATGIFDIQTEILRIVNTGTAVHYVEFSETPIAEVPTVASNGRVIEIAAGDAIMVVVPPGITNLRTSLLGLRLEIIEDN